MDLTLPRTCNHGCQKALVPASEDSNVWLSILSIYYRVLIQMVPAGGGVTLCWWISCSSHRACSKVLSSDAVRAYSLPEFLTMLNAKLNKRPKAKRDELLTRFVILPPILHHFPFEHQPRVNRMTSFLLYLVYCNTLAQQISGIIHGWL